jgi:outer membrane protein assembly factor BamB
MSARYLRLSLLLAFPVLAAGGAAGPADPAGPAPRPAWSQFGGPGRDFRVPSVGLAAVWPAAGPRVLWSRALGEGYSAIVERDGVLFTMYRPAKDAAAAKPARKEPETIVALDAATGATRWEHTYEAPILPRMNVEYGPGPHSTPLVADGRVFAVGSTGKLHALDAGTGRVLWAQDLWGTLGGSMQDRGYSCSPIAYGDTIVVSLGGAGQAAVAFRQKDGQIAWKSGAFPPSPSSPILIRVDGQEQLVFFNGDGIAGLDPRTGATLWTHPHKTDYGLNITMPVWGDDNLLFFSSAYSGGSRVLQLAQKDGRTTVKELWFTPRMRVHFGSAVRIADHVYGSSGDFGPAFFTGIHVRTGQVAFQDRSLARASVVAAADGRLVLLDEDGTLAVAAVSPAGLKIQAKAPVLANKAWTVPSLVGTRLYLRDRASIKALELGG